MSASFWNRRIDTLPRGPALIVLAYGMAAAALLWLVALLLRVTVRVRVVGREPAGSGRNGIYCLWHEAVPLLLVCGWPTLAAVLPPGRLCWLQHPLAHMKPIHVLLRMVGVERIVLGSTGHAGREGADAVARLLREGYSTVIQPDGPHGPPRVLKPGVLHLAAQSGVPVVPLRFAPSRAVRLRTWDRKVFPVPFSTITVTMGAPRRVSGADLDAAAADIAAALG